MNAAAKTLSDVDRRVVTRWRQERVPRPEGDNRAKGRGAPRRAQASGPFAQEEEFRATVSRTHPREGDPEATERLLRREVSVSSFRAPGASEGRGQPRGRAATRPHRAAHAARRGGGPGSARKVQMQRPPRPRPHLRHFFPLRGVQRLFPHQDPFLRFLFIFY